MIAIRRRQALLASAAAALLLAPLAGAMAGSAPAGAPDVRFQWALLKREPDGRAKGFATGQRMAAAAGDSIKLTLRPETNLFLYVLLLDSSDALYQLYPARGGAGEAAPSGREIALPSGDQWFAMDDVKGRETFHILASPQRLASLERALAGLKGLGEPQDVEAQRAVLAEVRTLSRLHSGLAGTAEKPISIAGTVRGAEAPDTAAVQEVAGRGFASKIIEVEHQ